MRPRSAVTAQRSQKCDRRVPSQPSRCQNAPAERQHSPAVARMRPRSGNTAQQVPERVRKSSVRPGRFQTRPQVVDAGLQVRERGSGSGIRNVAIMNRLAVPSQHFPLIFPCCDPLRRHHSGARVLPGGKPSPFQQITRPIEWRCERDRTPLGKQPRARHAEKKGATLRSPL